MSKTFKSAASDVSLTVEENFGDVQLRIHKDELVLEGICTSKSDAPALALAILEAAGVETCPYDSATSVQIALGHLREHVGIEAAKVKEAADREALERRRGELAVEYFEGAYEHLPRAAYRHTIDRIIELEDKAQS